MANSRKKQAKETSTASTRGPQPLRGWGLVIARIIWAAIAFTDLIVLILGVPALTIQVQKPCLDLTRATCSSLQLLPTQMATAQFLGISPGAYAVYTVTCDLLITLLFLIVGALIFWHKSNDWMGLFVSSLLITFGGLGADLVHTNALPGLLPSSNLIFLIYDFLSILSGALSLLVWPALGLFFCTFPDGRLVPRWSWIFPCLFVVQFVFYLLPSPWNFQNWPPLLQLLEILLVYGGSVGAQFYRYFFVASPLQRQQIKWLAFGFGLVVFVVLPLENLLQILNGPHSILQLADPFTLMFDYLPIPLAIGVALLRYRLWDIDRVINRTLVYGLLTLILAGIYLGLVFSGEALLVGIVGKNDDLVIVGSTLIVAILFQPLRRGIQNGIDRRFYRQKYDAQRTLKAFSATLHQQTDLAQLSEQIVVIVQETIQPAHISLWLRGPVGKESDGAPPGQE
ncbi:hypothetical protein KSD_90170 [Ktedonobacter sp. SOSP1-85]|uniref:hypothetical protein n=1 Tax=Ktedonobacter sp. SOSP1-85 TaxID=2778367 RepID=UPI0019154C1D|nr:hypothetical protein [Ktedonobacter sp. SOSP1-85]GHO81246.1 hypothetical protein KSD_90170 [Ktedonobacter sp. SOSP1-85]